MSKAEQRGVRDDGGPTAITEQRTVSVKEKGSVHELLGQHRHDRIKDHDGEPNLRSPTRERHEAVGEENVRGISDGATQHKERAENCRKAAKGESARQLAPQEESRIPEQIDEEAEKNRRQSVEEG